MNFFEVSKMIMNGERIYNIPLRVCFYARVSTDSDVQINSLENQLCYYKDFIQSKKSWIYIRGYTDEGISGVRVEKRTAFKEMIRDAKDGKFDLIITKEVSRFARDLEDSIHYIRVLKEANVGVYFENQNLNTFDSNSELILNIMFNLAQDESKKLSSRVKFGHREAIKKGHVLGSSNIIGYKKNKCKLVIVEEEAKFIRKVFELYASGEYGFYKLSKKLASLGYYNKSGNYYDKDTLKRIISNPKYKGFYRGKTSETIDYRTKKRIKVEENNQVIYRCSKDIIPPIVSEELWNIANTILKNRIKKDVSYSCFNGSLKYPLSSKIYCGDHNVRYQRSHGSKKKNRPIWSCGLYLQYGLETCKSPIIEEKDLYYIFSNIMNTIISDKELLIDDMVILYKKIGESSQYEPELKKIDSQLKYIENKKNIILDLVLNGDLEKNDLGNQLKILKNQNKLLSDEREKILHQIIKKNNSKEITKEIKTIVENDFLEEFIRQFVDKIIVYKIDDDRYNIELDIYLNLIGLELLRSNSSKNVSIFLNNQKCTSLNNSSRNKSKNHYTYNVFLEM